MVMSATRYSELRKGQSGTAQKVLDAIPITELWTLGKICAELKRTGTSIEHRIALGCARTLVEAGLVREPEPEQFIRATVKEPPKPTVLMGAKNHLIVVEPSETPMDKLARLADELKQVSKTAQRIAGEIEDAATSAEEEVQAIREKLAGFEQLGALLQKLTPKS